MFGVSSKGTTFRNGMNFTSFVKRFMIEELSWKD